MSRPVYVGASALWGLVTLVDADGAPKTGAAAADLSVSYQVEGAATVGPLELTLSTEPAWAEGKLLELGGGDYRIGLPLSLVAAANAGKAIRLFGALASGNLFGESLVVTEAAIPLAGPLLVTLVVTDDQDPAQAVQGGTVVAQINGGATRRQGSMDAEGKVALGLSAGEWTLLFDVEGHDSAPVDVTIAAEGEVPVTLPRKAPPANDDPNAALGTLRCYDPNLAVEPGAKVTFVLKSGNGAAGQLHNTRPRTFTVDEDGNDLEIKFLPDSTYYVIVGGGTTPDPNLTIDTPGPGESFLISQLLGRSKG